MALEALKTASKNIESNSAAAADRTSDGNSPSMKALLELETGSDDLFSGDPRLSTLSHLLSRLKALASSLHSAAATGGLRSFLRRRSGGHELSRVAGSIGSEIQSWIDRESTDRLVSDDVRAALLLALEARLKAAHGFDRDLQDVLLRSNAFAAVESTLTDSTASKRVRDCAAAVVLALVEFNKAVFVGHVLMGPTIRTLIAVASPAMLRALNGLIGAVRSPIVDEIHINNDIPKIVALLSSDDVEIRVLALGTVMEIGYHGRKEAIDDLMEEGIVERLLELQRSELGGALIEAEDGGEGIPVGGVRKEERLLELRPFASAVARFAIQMEVGDGLRQREKRAVKMEVVRRVREAVSDEVEEATVLAEVLWGSTTW